MPIGRRGPEVEEGLVLPFGFGRRVRIGRRPPFLLLAGGAAAAAAAVRGGRPGAVFARGAAVGAAPAPQCPRRLAIEAGAVWVGGEWVSCSLSFSPAGLVPPWLRGLSRIPLQTMTNPWPQDILILQGG